jgi:hypothetical protein
LRVAQPALGLGWLSDGDDGAWWRDGRHNAAERALPGGGGGRIGRCCHEPWAVPEKEKKEA